ncbi:MAG: hypothetical protein N4A44_03450 [Alphaproteobacteria bacterium]|nr:hypothetical protein [Alphaproteobacteria bacterium]
MLPMWLIPLLCFLAAAYLSLNIIRKNEYSHKPLISIIAVGLVIFGYSLLTPFSIETLLRQLRVSGLNMVCVISGCFAISALVISLIKAK